MNVGSVALNIAKTAGTGLAVIDLPVLLASALATMGVELAYDYFKDDIKEIFSVDNPVINPTQLQPANDTKTTKNIVEPVLKFDDMQEEQVDYNEYSANYVKFKMVDDYLSYSNNIENWKMDSDNIDIPDVIKSVEVPKVTDSSNLLDTMKSNTESLVTVLSTLNNTISSGVVTNSVVLGAIVKGLNALVSEVKDLKDILVLNGVNSSNIVDALSNLKLEAGSINIDNSKINDFIDYLKLNGLNIKNEVVENSMKTIASAKKLEKENYEYMKTPQTYTLIDEDIPKLAPREVIALSEAVKAHLNSQEASLTGEDLSEFENDFDLGDLMTKLFNFKGITGDIKKFEDLKVNENDNDNDGG